MPIDAADRAERIWLKIERKPTSVSFTRPSSTMGGVVTPATTLPEQVVRINSDSRASVVGGTAGLAPKRAVVIYGVVGHPSRPDNDIAEGYTFVLGTDHYRVIDIVEVPGGVQAHAVATG